MKQEKLKHHPHSLYCRNSSQALYNSKSNQRYKQYNKNWGGGERSKNKLYKFLNNLQLLLLGNDSIFFFRKFYSDM